VSSQAQYSRVLLWWDRWGTASLMRWSRWCCGWILGVGMWWKRVAVQRSLCSLQGHCLMTFCLVIWTEEIP
jgi:predicted membrane protein